MTTTFLSLPETVQEDILGLAMDNLNNSSKLSPLNLSGVKPELTCGYVHRRL